MGSCKEVIRMNKKLNTKTEKETWAEQSNYWIGNREDKVTKQKKRGLYVPKPDSVKPSKPFSIDKYNNWTELKKIKRKNYFSNAILELLSWGFSKEEVISCANITAALEKFFVRQKLISTYREGDAV